MRLTAFDAACNDYNNLVLRLYTEKQMKTLTPQRAEELIADAMSVLRGMTKNPGSIETDEMIATVSRELWEECFPTQ